MVTMTPARLAVRHPRRIPLAVGPRAAVEARAQVRAAICAWDLPVDESDAVLLTSELVTNAITHSSGETMTLVLTCDERQLRVDVHDSSPCLPVPASVAPDAEAGRGLMLVATLSEGWGFYRTPWGKAVYFTLPFQVPC